MTSAEPQPALGLKAWGKVILFGEHSVVYGSRAVAAAIDRCLRLRPQTQERVTIPDWDLDVSLDADHPVAQAVRSMSAKAGRQTGLRGSASIPAAAGLGSSAAFCVATARCLAPDASREEIEELSSLGESTFHDRPSGVDVALSSRGGTGVFRKGEGFSPLDCPSLSIVVGLSGQSRKTADLVEKVARQREEDVQVRAALAHLGELAESGIEALAKEDLEEVGSLMNRAHESLVALGVSTDALCQMCAVARAAGAIGAKLTGAGGGGAIIALCPGREVEVQSALAEAGFRSFTTATHAPGGHQ